MATEEKLDEIVQPKRRGRKPKIKEEGEFEIADDIQPKRRGRKPRVLDEEPEEADIPGDEEVEEMEEEVEEKRPRGRRPRIKDNFIEPCESTTIPVSSEIAALNSDPEVYFVPMDTDDTCLINLLACGISSWPPKEGHGRERCPFLVIELIIEGEGELEVNGFKHQVTAKDAILLHFNETNGLTNTGKTRLKKIWITLRQSPITPVLSALNLDSVSKVSFQDNDYDKIRRYFMDVINEVKTRGPDFRFEAAAHCFRIFHLMARQAKVLTKQKVNDIPPALQDVINYVEKNISRVISIDELAEVAGCCRVHLTRLFTKHMGLHTRDWLMHYRMRKACHLLKTTEMQVNLLAKEVGFDDPYHFSTAFRKKVGMPPLKYRRMSRKGAVPELV